MSTKKKISDIDKAIEEMQQRRDECFKHIGKAMYESCPELGDMSVADMRKAGRYLHKLFVILDSLYILFHFNGKFAQRIADRPSSRTAFICQKQHISGILVSSIDLVKVTNGAQHHNTFDSAPVNGIRNLRSLRILPTADQVFDFFRS